MNSEQQKRVETLADQVAEQFIAAASPGNWTGDGLAPDKMSPEVRGARNWDVKNANQIGALLARCLDLRDRIATPAGDGPDDAAEADIGKFEKQARAIVKKVREGA
jgi:hypothetical protein